MRLPVFAGVGGADDRLFPCGDDGGVGGGGKNGAVRQAVQFLKIGIAKNQAVIGVPQHEGFRDRLDGVAQPQIRGRCFRHKILLFRNVDRDTDEMQSRLVLLARQFASYAQPQPAAVGMAHAEGVVDRLRLRVGKPCRQSVEVDIVRMDQRRELTESEQFVLCRQAEHVEHRMRPENTAARQIPIPQAAAAAIKRGVNAAAHGVVDQIRLSGARGLPMKRESEDENDEAGRRRERNGQRRGRTPCYERAARRLDDGK